jgi:hypothetical protein
MEVWHDSSPADHPGRNKTTRRVTNRYHWLGAKHWIADYVKGCATCQQNKNLTHWIWMPLYWIPSSPSACPFSHIAMDLIMGLQKSKRIQCHTHYSRSRGHPRRNILAMLYHNNRTLNHQTISQACIPMVRTSVAVALAGHFQKTGITWWINYAKSRKYLGRQSILKAGGSLKMVPRSDQPFPHNLSSARISN